MHQSPYLSDLAHTDAASVDVPCDAAAIAGDAVPPEVALFLSFGGPLCELAFFFRPRSSDARLSPFGQALCQAPPVLTSFQDIDMRLATGKRRFRVRIPPVAAATWAAACGPLFLPHLCAISDDTGACGAYADESNVVVIVCTFSEATMRTFVDDVLPFINSTQLMRPSDAAAPSMAASEPAPSVSESLVAKYDAKPPGTGPHPPPAAAAPCSHHPHPVAAVATAEGPSIIRRTAPPPPITSRTIGAVRDDDDETLESLLAAVVADAKPTQAAPPRKRGRAQTVHCPRSDAPADAKRVARTARPPPRPLAAAAEHPTTAPSNKVGSERPIATQGTTHQVQQAPSAIIPDVRAASVLMVPTGDDTLSNLMENFSGLVRQAQATRAKSEAAFRAHRAMGQRLDDIAAAVRSSLVPERERVELAIAHLSDVIVPRWSADIDDLKAMIQSATSYRETIDVILAEVELCRSGASAASTADLS